MGDISAQSTVFEEQVNTAAPKVPIHHVGLGVGLLIVAVIGVGYLNHRANR